jgi:hypothetical protein
MYLFHILTDGLVALAALVSVLDYFGIKPVRPLWGLTTPLKQNWKLAVMLVLVSASLGMSGYDLYKSFQKSTNQNYFLGWGPLEALVDTTVLIQDKDDSRLMLVGVVRDPAIDPMVDVALARSRTYEIESPTVDMVIVPTQAFLAKYGIGKTVTVYLLEVPKDFPIERLTSLAEVEHLRGRILQVQGSLVTIRGPNLPG